jgi:cellulose synthase/poly-beta-1,6-N-acetylglucosamine synthase-like glycosyltransferase
MQIDDDIALEPNMSFPITKNTSCIAYTISATNFNGPEGLIHMFQDLEYKLSGIMKMIEAHFASTTFPHGAISLWKRDVLLKVLEQHPMFPLSDDWFMGTICNRMGHRIETCATMFIKTDVPSNYLHQDSASRASGYGQVTLFDQRFKRWYRFTIVQVFYMMYDIFFSWKLPLRRAIMLKIIWLWRIVNVLIVLVKFIVLFQILYMHPQSIIASLVIVFFGSFLSIWVIVLRQLHKDERPSLKVLMLFNFYKVYDSLCFMVSMYWSIVVAIPMTLTLKRVTLKNNPMLSTSLTTHRKT